VEISRNDGLNGPKGNDFALAVEAELAKRVAMQARAPGDLGIAEPAGFDESQGAGDVAIDCEHLCDKAHSNGLRNGKAHYNGLFSAPDAHYKVRMPFSPDAARTAISQVAEKHGLTPTGWARKAKLGRNTLTAFLSGRNDGIELSTICALADVAHVHPYDLMGISPPGELALEVAALETIERNLQRISSTYEGAASDAQTALTLVRAAVRARTNDTQGGSLPQARSAQPKKMRSTAARSRARPES
jgi:hypothetical protein